MVIDVLSDASHVYFALYTGAIYRIPIRGGALEPVTLANDSSARLTDAGAYLYAQGRLARVSTMRVRSSPRMRPGSAAVP
jgi:hypothetical protein